MSRAGATAIYSGPPLSPDELVHPYLCPTAAVFSRWQGREAFHAGALIVNGGAWALLGPKEAGKSTLLAAHAARGGQVLADDLVVVDHDLAFAGPRAIDLRSPPLDEFASETSVTPARSGSRWRVTLRDIAPSVPLLGWVFLRWGETFELSPMRPSESLGRLAGWRAWRQLASDPAQMLTLAGLPAFSLSRLRKRAALNQALDQLTETLAGRHLRP